MKNYTVKSHKAGCTCLECVQARTYLILDNQIPAEKLSIAKPENRGSDPYNNVLQFRRKQ